MIKLLLDENMPVKLDSLLSAKGWDIKRVPSGTPDEKIAEIGKKEERVLITQDKHFADIRIYPPESFSGIIRLRFSPPLTAEMFSSLERLFSMFPREELSGKLIILRKNKIQLR